MVLARLPDDIARRVTELFPDSDREAAASWLLRAKIHDGSTAGPRLQRCALIASRGSLEKLEYYVRLLAVDFRDVVVAGEYEVSDSGSLTRVRDLTRPL